MTISPSTHLTQVFNPGRIADKVREQGWRIVHALSAEGWSHKNDRNITVCTRSNHAFTRRVLIEIE